MSSTYSDKEGHLIYTIISMLGYPKSQIAIADSYLFSVNASILESHHQSRCSNYVPKLTNNYIKKRLLNRVL